MFSALSKSIKLLCKHRSNIKFFFAHRKYTKETMNSIVGDLNEIFLCGVSAVQPKHIFQSKCFCINDTKTSIVCQFNESRVEVDLRDRQCHLVGFGKAVFGMASELSGVLGERLMSGIISVPLHTIEKFSQIQLPASIQVLEGAKNNLPDAAAESAAIKIMEFVDNLNKNDILFVLISGGGSALLPLPCAGVTLDEKLDVIKKLANKGATISDINRVRIDLSQTKGGKLAAIGAKRTHRVIGLIISDIIGDPIDSIASGPTVIKSEKNKISSIDVLKHYDLWNTLASNIQNAITANSTTKIHLEAKNFENLIIANNTIAVNAALNAIKEKNSLGMILSKQIDGNVSEISQMYFKLAEAIQKFKHRKIDENKFFDQITSTQRTLKFEKNFLDKVLELIAQSEAEAKDFCLIGAGEPTVEVIGNGLGGRNQELALRFSRKCFDDKLLHNVWLLSAGTDGIDGPTTAAGALGSTDIIHNYLKTSNKSLSDIDAFIQNNDSYHFYSSLANGQYHIVTGHTGTNVMDLHLLYFKHEPHQK